MTEKALVRDTFFKFFIPTLAASVTLSVLSMTDLIIAGHFVGEQGLSAISLALPVVIFIQIVSALMGTGGAIVFSASLGEGDLKACSRVFTMALFGAFLTGLLSAAAGLSFLESVVRFLGAVLPEETAMASAYIGTLFWGMPFMILSPVMMTFLRNDSRQGYSMFCVVFCSLFNIVFSLAFCVGFRLGIRGIAAATVISQAISCVLAGRVLFRRNKGYGFTRDFWKPSLFGAMLKPGSTIAMIFLCQVFLTVTVNRILAAQGGAAVYAVIKYLINFQFALFDGVTGAIQPMLGIYYGEREKENIRTTAQYAFCTMMVISLAMFLLMELGGTFICMVFGVEGARLEEMTILAARIIGISCFGAGAVTFLNAFYRCVGKEKISLLLSLSDNLVFPLAGILLLENVLSRGTDGVFLGLAFSSCFTLLLWIFVCRPLKNGVLLLEELRFTRTGEDYHVIVPAVIEEISRVMEQVEEYCLTMGVSMKTQYYINLSIEELLLNVVGLAQEGQEKRSMKRNTERKNRNSFRYYADIHIYPVESGRVRLRIRDNLTEWLPSDVDISDMNLLEEEDKAGGQNELGIGIVKKIAKEYSYKRTIGFNNFSVIL